MIKSLALLFLPFILYADLSDLSSGSLNHVTTPPSEAQPSRLPSYFEVQGRVGGQYFLSSKFRSVYQNWSPVYQVELSSGNWKGLYGWLNGGWMGVKGRTNSFDERTKVSLVPLSAGLKYAFYQMKYAFFYIGVGPAYSHLFIHDYSPYVKNYIKQWHWGVVAKSGVRFFIPSRFFAELFFDYNYLPFSFRSTTSKKRFTIDVGGLLIGGSVGYSF